MGETGGLTDEEKARSSIFVRFIDILFAVVLGQSFVFLSSNEGITKWMVAPLDNIIPVANTLLAYTLVVTSWVGYHASIAKLPIRNVLRFVIDLVLLLFYYLAFVSVGSFHALSTILFLVFLLYFLWTLVRLYEYWNQRVEWNLVRRSVQAGVFAVLFLFVAVLKGTYADQTLEGILLATSFVLLISYRLLYWGGPKLKKSRNA